MKRFTTALAIAALAFSQTGCALLQSSPLVSDDPASDNTRVYADGIFRGFKLIWIPLLDRYSKWDECSDTKKMPCRVERAYAVMHRATDVATACMVEATKPGVLLFRVQECLGRVAEAKLAFTQGGLVPQGVTQ